MTQDYQAELLRLSQAAVYEASTANLCHIVESVHPKTYNSVGMCRARLRASHALHAKFTAAFHTASGAASKSKGCEWPNTKLMRGKAASGAHAG